MELLTLNSEFQPVKLIDNYESLVWSERYYDSGDFELKSGDIAQAKAAMPLESYVSLRESSVPMVVESYKILKPLRASPLIEISRQVV